MEQNKCIYISEDEISCKAFAIADSGFCLSHDPTKKQARVERAKKGGEADSYQSLDLSLQPLQVTNAGDIVIASVQLINEIREGKLPPKIANSIGYLLGIALKAIEISDVEKRVETIERVIVERSRK